MNYHVVVSHRNKVATLASNKSLDYLPHTFIKESTKNVDPENLASYLKYLIIDDKGDPHGMMLWVKAQGHKLPILMVQLSNRNILMMYNHKGHLISKDSIK